MATSCGFESHRPHQKLAQVDHTFIGGAITRAAHNWLGDALRAKKRSQVIFNLYDTARSYEFQAICRQGAVELATHETFKTIVNQLPEGDKRLAAIEQALMSTGVVRGEFGFVEAYRTKKAEIQPWLSDTRPRVKRFAEQYERSVERAIGGEHRRAEQDLEMRKHRFDSGTDS